MSEHTPLTVDDVPEEQNPQNENLRAGLAEIQAILDRRDLAGHVLLYRNHLSKYLTKIDPSWSVARIEDHRFSLSSHKADYAGDTDQQQRDLEETVGMILHFKELLQAEAQTFAQLAAYIHQMLTAKKFDVAHSPGIFTPDRKK